MGKSATDEKDLKICVLYDGACPTCVRDRRNYERLAGRAAENVEWLDITGKEDELAAKGIDPEKALLELHVIDQHHQVYSEMDAYVLLMSRVTLLKPLAWLIDLPVIKPILSAIYRRWVRNRLQQDGRLPAKEK